MVHSEMGTLWRRIVVGFLCGFTLLHASYQPAHMSSKS